MSWDIDDFLTLRSRESITFEAFKVEANKLGLIANDKGSGHWQVKGNFLVNFYPESRKGMTVYISGTNHGVKVSKIEEVFKLANEFAIKLDKTGRKQNYTRHKKWLWKKSKLCYWCKNPVSYDKASVEHIIPLSKGGLNNRNNYALAHQECNLKRGNKV